MVLVLSEKVEIANPVKEGLEKAGYEACSVTKINMAEIQRMQPKLVVLDWNFPDSKKIVQIVKSSCKGACVITLTQKHAVEEVIDSLDAGVDDYVEKPFPFNILLERAQAVMKGPWKDLP